MSMTTTQDKDPEIFEHIKQALGKLPPPDQAEDWGPYLPLFFRLKGQPMTMELHKPLSFFYKRIPAWKTMAICGRQVGKSQGICGGGLITSALRPDTQSLYVTPLFEMARRLSSNVMRPLLNESPVKGIFQNTKCEKSVLQKTLINRSMIHFSFAFLDCDRCRGLSVDRIYYDEVQNFDPSFLPIIAEAMSASSWGLSSYTGTPLTLDNTIELEWQKSSRAEWRVLCDHCNHINYMSTKYDLLNMIGTVKKVKLYGTGLHCARCKKPVYPIVGRWAHQAPQLIHTYAGYHLPQPALPLHYADERHWSEFLYKYETWPWPVFKNECLGESEDFGITLVSQTDLERASRLPWSLEEAFDQPATDMYKRRYRKIALGVDWGGGGSKEESSTAVAVCGITGTGDIEVIYIERFPFSYTHNDELMRIFFLYEKFGCHILAHDWGGAGRRADTMLRQARVIPEEQIMPIGYVATGQRDLITHNPAKTATGFYTYSYDKTWSLGLLCSFIQDQRVWFPRWVPKRSQPLLADFLHLIQEKRESNFKGDLYLIKKQAGQKDDVVHAINFAMAALFHNTGGFPDIASTFRKALHRFRMGGSAEYEWVSAHPTGDLTMDDWGEGTY